MTAGLKKVKKGEGLADRPIPVPKAAPTASAPRAQPSAAPAKPPSFGLNGKKWEVQYQVRVEARVRVLWQVRVAGICDGTVSVRLAEL